MLTLSLQASADPADGSDPMTLPGLADAADLVALVRVADTDYVYTRGFPSGGSAYLSILIRYKPAELRKDLVEVYEEGLHEHECYFENPTVFEEGRRYLGFFRNDADDPETYRGLDSGCALEVLVTEGNRYALRLPLDGFDLDPALARYAEEMDFRDRYAVLGEDAISPDRRNELLEQGLLKRHGDGYKYTRGIDLTTARRLLNLER
ncbi:MAG: hypothetical protein PVJ71_05995 [Lysobacterales bacterium]